MTGYLSRMVSRARQDTPSVRPQAVLPMRAPTRDGDAFGLDEITAEHTPDGDDRTRHPRASDSAATRPDAAAVTAPPSNVRASGRVDTPRAVAGDDSSAPHTRVQRTRIDDAHDEDGARERLMTARGSTEPRIFGAPPIDARSDAPMPVAHDRADRRSADPADFRLVPDAHIPDVAVAPTPRPHVDDGAFAQAVREARVQIERQLGARSDSPTEVHVTIGRIEVTAAAPSTAAATRPAERRTSTSLAQYLAGRARGNK